MRVSASSNIPFLHHLDRKRFGTAVTTAVHEFVALMVMR